MAKPRLLAFYLPQYYPTKENDEWWGKGFTEWTNVSMSRPLFKSHNQPQIPGELGFYDLRTTQTRIDQENLAMEHRIEGFIYWNYWLGEGLKVLEKPLQWKLETPEQKLPFCLAWANHDWKGVFFGSRKKLLTQTYPGKQDMIDHFNYLKSAFEDPRYIRVGNRPVFYIYHPKGMPDIDLFMETWNQLAVDELGADGFYFIGEGIPRKMGENLGFEGIAYSNHRKIASHKAIGTQNKYLNYFVWQIIKKRGLQVFRYEDAMKYFLEEGADEKNVYPCIVPNWDTSPRLGKNAVILKDSTPELFEKHVSEVFAAVKDKDADTNFVFIKSWNEWAEGNFLEPSWQHQRAYIEALRNQFDKFF